MFLMSFEVKTLFNKLLTVYETNTIYSRSYTF